MQQLFIIAGLLSIGIQLLFLNKINKILMKQEELAAELVALKAQNEKAKGEILAKFTVLEGQIGGTSPEVDAALADLKTSIQGTDDIVPDAPVEEPAA